MTEPCDLSAVAARRLIGTGKLSPTELLESCVKRIEKTNGKVNAIVAMDVDAARKGARAVEETMRKGGETGLLGGLPVGVKDLQATAGLRTTWGSLLLKDNVPAEDELSVANVRRAGGIILAKTNTPEFGAGANTTNRVYGPTGNPFDPTKTSAGSSGGSAVALALGMVPLATGSDYGGSLRTPASFCGVVGFRPSPGTVPNVDRAASLVPFGVTGPMGRTVEDAHLLLQAHRSVRTSATRSPPATTGASRRGSRVPTSPACASPSRPTSAARRSTRRSRRPFRRGSRRSARPSARCRSARPTSPMCTTCSRSTAASTSSPPIANGWRSRASCSTATSSTTPSAVSS